MASDSELAAKKVAPKWAVGPKEDVVQALMETLVDPLLPIRVSNVPPSEDSQKSVAKQMHAVVLLYNYYHRKQEPEQLFLDFVSFCKLALAIRPPLTAFMKLMMESESMELNCAENQFSLTEKAIKEACDIAAALDASKDVPKIEQWRISKVVVLLIDSKKENCMLHFGTVTQGVWSPIEKVLIDSSINLEISAGQNVGDKRKRNDQKLSTNDHDKFLQLGYDAVKDIAGIESSDLEVLETHVTYSLSKEKSAARFYLMQFSGSFSIRNQVPLKFLVESLQGPLAEKLDYGFWRSTAVVEYYHMLPYVELISSWLSRKMADGGKNSSSRILENISNGDKQHEKSSSGPSRSSSQGTLNDDNASEKFNNRCNVNDSALKEVSRSNLEISKTENDEQQKGSLSGKAAKDENVIKKSNIKSDFLDSAKRDEYHEGSLSGPSRGQQMISTTDLTMTCPKSHEDASKKLNSKIRAYHQRRMNNSSIQNDADVRDDAVDLKVDKVDFLTSNRTKCRDEKAPGHEGDLTISCIQNGIAAKGNQLIQFHAKTKYDTEISDSGELQNALALLYGKRQELYSQLWDMEDTLALYEDNITRIRDGGDVGLARRCIESILTGNDHPLLEHGTQIQDKGHGSGEDNHRSQPEKHTKLSETIFVPGKSSCQDLEYTCLKNNWRMPRYFIKPTDGKFISDVIIEEQDFKLSSKGGLKSRPCKARESAATNMIAKIQSIVHDRAD